MVEFGIHLAGPSAEEMSDRHAYYRDLLTLGQGAFSSAWVSDHLMFADAPVLEGWTSIAYLAAEFPAYRFGNLVLGQSYRNPALLAKMAATLQYLTSGRLTLGIGAGWREDEYRAYGYPFPSAGARVEQLGEAIDVVRAMWTGSPATFVGRHYEIHDAYCVPAPEPKIPILVGGHRPKLMRVVAEKADIWQWDGPIERYRIPHQRLVDACLEIGRDLSSIQLSVAGEAYFPADPDSFPETKPWVGDDEVPRQEIEWILGPRPEDAIRQLRDFVDLGVSLVTMYFHDRRTLESFAREVIPAFA